MLIVLSVTDALISEKNAAKYGTRHVLVLAGFSPSLRTSDLVKLFVVSSKTVDFSFVGSMIQQPLQSSNIIFDFIFSIH